RQTRRRPRHEPIFSRPRFSATVPPRIGAISAPWVTLQGRMQDMPGFKIHISASTTLGIAYGGTAMLVYHQPLETSLLAAGLCSVSGMLPDLDSGPGRPLRESVTFGAAVVPMLLID